MLARRPFRPLPRPVGTPVRWERAVLREGRATFSFLLGILIFLHKWLYFSVPAFLDYKIISAVIAHTGDCGKYCGCL
jgi:hypothetical protein